MDFELLSQAFKPDKAIPDLYTCKGKDISPPLMWRNSPEGTKSFALIMEDLDSPLVTITHWVIYNIPSNTRKLSEEIPIQASLPEGINQGKNWKQRNGYVGPCPPWFTRRKHRYSFTIYALNTVLPADPKMSKKKLLKTIKNHIISRANLIGYYSKK